MNCLISRESPNRKLCGQYQLSFVLTRRVWRAHPHSTKMVATLLQIEGFLPGQRPREAICAPSLGLLTKFGQPEKHSQAVRFPQQVAGQALRLWSHRAAGLLSMLTTGSTSASCRPVVLGGRLFEFELGRPAPRLHEKEEDQNVLDTFC